MDLCQQLIFSIDYYMHTLTCERKKWKMESDSLLYDGLWRYEGLEILNEIKRLCQNDQAQIRSLSLLWKFQVCILRTNVIMIHTASSD